MKKALAIIMVAAMALSLAACGGSSSSAAASTAASKPASTAASTAASGTKYKVYLISMDQMDQHWVNMDKGCQKAAAESAGSAPLSDALREKVLAAIDTIK